jgi:hypothetical protein
MFASPAVYTRRSMLADQLRKPHFGIGPLFSRDLTVQRDEQYPCWKVAYFLPCTRPPDVMRMHRPPKRNLRPFSSQRLCRHELLDIAMPGYIAHLTPCTRRDTSSLLPAFSPPSSQGCSSRGHFLFLLLQVLSRSYSLYSGEHFLFYVFVISVFSVFTYIQKVIHCAHTRSRSALLVYLGESTGSLSGLISLSISDFSIGSVQSHHIYVFCTSSLALNLEGHIYI